MSAQTIAEVTADARCLASALDAAVESLKKRGGDIWIRPDVFEAWQRHRVRPCPPSEEKA